MKKGLTLVEMIAIMSIFAIIVFISFPIIDGMIKQGDEDKYNLFLNDIYLATEAYIQKYSDNYPDLNSSYNFVYMKELVEEKLVKSTLVNPKYCDNNGCSSKQISTCNQNNECVVDDYTIIVGKDTSGVLKYLLVNKMITKVCIKDDTNCTPNLNTIILKINDDGSFEEYEEE